MAFWSFGGGRDAAVVPQGGFQAAWGVRRWTPACYPQSTRPGHAHHNAPAHPT